MTAIEIATGIIDKLQEENRVCLATLHKTQDTNKYYERQLAEKDRLVKMLEERLRSGTDGILEMSNRQKELTIKHLELQIQKLLKENEELEIKLDAIKAEICPRCETKLLLRENNENRSASKLYKPPGKTSSGLFEKKTTQPLCPNRIKSMERIIEHKDKRIMHLSKEVQRLTKSEKELNQKIYRLTKLLPMSRLPPETLTDCLLKEIQSLESQKDGCKNSCDRLQINDDVFKLKKSSLGSRISAGKSHVSKSCDRPQKSSSSNLKLSTTSLPESEQPDTSDIHRVENEVLFKKLQKLCNDINELKRLFAFESEKLSEDLHSTANEYNSFKIYLEEIINNLNDVLQSILNNGFNTLQGNTSVDSDDKYVISCLQQRLKESLGMVTEYENENKILKEKLDQLKSQLGKQDSSVDCRKSEDKIFKSFTDSHSMQNINDVKKLKEIIKIKETQLESAESHINTCQKFIEELQKTLKRTSFENLKTQCTCRFGDDGKMSNSYEQLNKVLQTKLDVAEKNIKTCETVIEQLQNSVQRLEEENVRIESELHIAKAKAMSETTGIHTAALHSKLGSYSDTCINTRKNLNQELQDKIKTLEEVNSKLKANLKSSETKNNSLEITEQEKTLKSKLDASEKHICALQKSVEILQDKIKTVETEKSKLEAELKEVNKINNLAEVYENDVMSLKNELILKETENRDLKESLHTLESKALEMNHYRNSLHQEIEKLCKTLMENEETEDSKRRKIIYKAAILRSAQALLRLDDNYNLKPEDSGRNSALEEMKHQIQVYLTEVSRIHELVTIKEHERDELLREYLDLNDHALLRPSSSLHHEYHTQGEATDANLQTSNLQSADALKSDFLGSKEAESFKTNIHKNVKFDSAELNAEFKILQEELNATKSVTAYLLSSCTRLEDLLSKERTERAKCERELEVYEETVKDLKVQLSMKNNTTKRLNTLIETMRSMKFNDEITLEQLQSEIKWLVDENRKVFERVTSTQSELCQCKEENSRVQNDLDSMKRQLLNEKYEHAKVNNELKHLRLQISNSQSTLNEEH